VPPLCPLPDYIKMLRTIGCERAVLVQASVNGTDNSMIAEAIKSGSFPLRGVAVVSEEVTDRQLEDLHAAGFRGIRINVASGTPGLKLEHAPRLAQRIKPLGWHLQFYMNFHPEHETLLGELPVNIVIDHFGHPDPSDPLNCPGFQAMIAAAETGCCWIKLSGGFRLAGPAAWQDDPDGDLEETAKQVAEALLARVGTDRLLWGSDAPFVGYEKRLAYPDVLRTYRAWVPDAPRRAEIDRTALKLFFG